MIASAASASAFADNVRQPYSSQRRIGAFKVTGFHAVRTGSSGKSILPRPFRSPAAKKHNKSIENNK